MNLFILASFNFFLLLSPMKCRVNIENKDLTNFFIFIDLANEISDTEMCNHLENYLPIAKATICETCTLVTSARIRSDQILIPKNNEKCVFSKKYGENTELTITFPANITNQIMCLKIQVYNK